ncbi:MAG: hypothetical protein U9Q74_13160 [Gemmatimonadota bacterium]|nr:hypothetical protein [Gemmatimonadota bacterium]
MSRSVPLVAVALAVLAVAACDFQPGGLAGSPVALGTFTTGRAGTTYSMQPIIGFYRVTGAVFVNTAFVTDTCFEAPYADTTSQNSNASLAISAGDYVVLAVSGRSDTLRRSSTVDPFYRVGGGLSIPFTPGDSMVITVKGDPNGFPASTFRGKTAEPFTFGPITKPADGNPITITWSPAGVGGSAILVALRFASGTSTTIDRQVACTLVDDGTATIPGTTILNWLRATKHDVVGQRLRSILQQVDVPRSYFNVTSVFETSATVP